MSTAVLEPSFSLSSRVSQQVDGALVNLRWALIVLAWVSIATVAHSFYPDDYVRLWLIVYAVFNGLLWVGLRYRPMPPHLPSLALIGDMVFLGILPLLPGANNPYLILFAIFPTLVAAMRFGVTPGALVAVTVLLPYEGAALLSALPPGIRALIPIKINTDINLLSAALPVIALLGAIVLVGYITQREREAAVGAAQVELDELRKAISSARLFYESSDALNSSSNYVQILEVMLQAGVSGMPHGRFDQGAPVGIALVYENVKDSDHEKVLTIASSRGLDRSDVPRTIPGTRGIVAHAMESGDPVPFTKISNDPELGGFTSLGRAHTGICYPLQSGLDVYGAVILASPGNQMPSEQHQRLIRAFINQAAIAFQNAQLYKNLRTERDRIIEAEASARARLARDLHDGPTQSMAALAMRLDFIRLLLDRDQAQAKTELEQSREVVMRVGKDLRGLLFTLRPLTLETQGLSATLKQYEQRLRENDDVPITVQPGNFGIELNPNVAATVFAVIEEAVNNARKHAPDSPIEVIVASSGGALVASVRDQGAGFDVSAVNTNYSERGSFGMLNMRDRARLVDGQLVVESTPGRGTRVTLRVPLNDRNPKSSSNGSAKPKP